MGHLSCIAFPTLGNLTKNLGPTVRTFVFFVQRNGTKAHWHMCLSVRLSQLGLEVAWLKP